MHVWMDDVNDGCLAKGEGAIEKISVFQKGVKPTTSVKTLGWNSEIFSVVPLPVARPPVHFLLTFSGARPLYDHEYTSVLFKFGRESSFLSGTHAKGFQNFHFSGIILVSYTFANQDPCSKLRYWLLKMR